MSPSRSRLTFPPFLILLSVLEWTGAALAADCTQPPGPGVDWQRCYVDGRDLQGKVLTGARLIDGSFERSNLSKADLTRASGYHAKFISSILAGARLDDGTFPEADFTRADLTGASLRNADLRRARFFRANLTGADLTGAKTLGADMLNADMSGATWTDGKHICAPGSIGQCN